jgi:hypothetical protein
MDKSINPTQEQETPVSCLNTCAFGHICSRIYDGCESEPCFKANNSFPECINPQETIEREV